MGFWGRVILVSKAVLCSKLSLSEDCCEQLVNTEPDFFLCSANWLRLYAKNQVRS